MFQTEAALAVWQTLRDAELIELGRAQFAELTKLDGEDLEEAWADFNDARERVFPSEDAAESAFMRATEGRA